MNTNNKNNYLPSLNEDLVIISQVFNYIKNYLHANEEMDHLDMEFVDSIITFCNTFLTSIYFKSEESILFKKLTDLSINPLMTVKMKEVTTEHHFIDYLVKKLSLLQTQYNTGNNSCIEEIHSLLRTLSESFDKLTRKQKELFPLIDQFLSSSQKEQLNSELQQFNQSIIKELIHHLIIEKYQKYNTIPKNLTQVE